MRKFTSVFGMLLAALILPLCVSATEVDALSAAVNPAVRQMVNAKAYAGNGLQLCKAGTLKTAGEIGATIGQRRSAKASAKQKADGTVALDGNYVQTFKTLVSSGADGGKGVVIALGENNEVTFTNFYEQGLVVKGTVDMATKTITIANQVVGSNSTYGELDLAVCGVSAEGKPVPERTKKITGTIGDDGTITIDTWWGIFVKSGDYADAYFGLYYNTLFEKANGTMTDKTLVTSTTPFTENTTTYPVIVSQPSKNIVSVKNLGNFGQTVDAIINRDGTITIETQKVRGDVTNGDWYTYAITYADGKLATRETTITGKVSADKKGIEWKDWSTFNIGGTNKYYSGIHTSATVTSDVDIEIPSLSVTDFEGEGTEASPFLIKQLDDLILLSDKVNGDETMDNTAPSGAKYNRTYLGKYFRLENDIDMAGYRFTPIGKDWSHIFAGTFDGNNHKISNLTVSTASAGYAALFGRTDTLSVLKNVTLDKPNVQASGNYAAGLAGWSMGTIENVHVRDAQISNEGRCAGSIAGIVGTLKNSDAIGGVITGLGGNASGLAGEVDILAENCFAEDIKIIAGSLASGYPAGGLFGSVYKSTARNCYFKGVVDGKSTYTSGMVVGGVAGTCYGGKLENCFSVGTVTAYDSDAVLGGVVGTLYGSMENCYSTGVVYDLSSKKTGGLVGYLRPYVESNGTTHQSIVKNCYTATLVTAETYQYKPETEIREVIGTVEDGTTPTISNVYFDKKITNFTSIQHSATTADLTSASGVAGFDASVWTFAEGQYPRLKAMAETEAAKMSASAVVLPEGSTMNKVAADGKINALGATTYKFLVNGALTTEGHFCSISGGELKITENFGTDTLVVLNGGTNYVYYLKVAPIPFEGEGTEVNPYLIKTKADMITLSEVTTNIKQYFANTYFKMVNDIDLEQDPAFLGICTDAADAHNQFAGIFDGDGHTIHNMYINAVGWTTTPEDDTTGQGGKPNTSESKAYKGVVGRLAPDGVVKNLTVAADSKIIAWATTGAIVGYNYGVVENCKNYADVTGYSCWIGGVVGQSLKGSIVKDCYNAGNVVSGYMCAGGILGSASGTIENCMNVGDVAVKSISQFNLPTSTKLNLAGGIVGSTSGVVIKNCVNYGSVHATVGKAGGIAGSFSASGATAGSGLNDMANTINCGVVTCSDQTLIGGIGGVGGTTGTIANNYWDAQILPLKASGNAEQSGMTGAETADLTSGTALEGYDAELWQFTAGQYPMLKQFAGEDKAQRASKAVVTMAKGVDAKDMSADAALAAVDGCAWTLKNGTDFKIEGNTLKTPATVSAIIEDELTATYGDYVKVIALSRIPSVPLAGSGTAEDPYLIASTADWNNLSDYITSAGIDFKGEYLKVANDIDFAEGEFKMMGADGVTTFNGNLDGANHTIKGIKMTASGTYQGAFGIIGESAEVKDLTLNGTMTNTTSMNVGGFSGKVYGKLTNCVNEISVNSTKSGVSGFGSAFKGAVLTKCVNKAEITGTSSNIAGLMGTSEEGVEYIECSNEGKIVNNGTGSYTAGLVGTCYPSKFEKCFNVGEFVMKTPASAANIGGLVGYANKATANTHEYVFTDCYNEADIQGKGLLGGLVGGLNASATIVNPLTFERCYNTGDISAVATTAATGNPTAGISALYSAGSKFIECWNEGTITSMKQVYAGGITGYYKTAGNADKPVILKKCYNKGNIAAFGNQGGGIVAYATNFVMLDSCYNNGPIEGGFGLGGIAGCLSGTSSVMTNCWNSGDVTTSTNRAGGLIGYNATKSTVTKCFNVANVATTNETQGTTASCGYGIGGLAGQGASVFTMCYNTGTVSGASQVGGLLGYPSKNNTQITKCYNAGKIVAPADTCGAIVGVDITNGKLWTESNVVTDTYYVTDFGTYDNAPVGTAMKMSELAKLDMGEGWTSADDYSLPIFDAANECALVNSAAVIVDAEDTYESVTKDFKVGAPAGVTWTPSSSVISVSGNAATIMNASTDEVTLTATLGDYKKMWTLKLNATSGIDDLMNGKTIVNEVYYGVNGVEVAKPTVKTGQVYLVKRTYDDGTTEIVKVVK